MEKEKIHISEIFQIRIDKCINAEGSREKHDYNIFVYNSEK